MTLVSIQEPLLRQVTVKSKFVDICVEIGYSLIT